MAVEPRDERFLTIGAFDDVDCGVRHALGRRAEAREEAQFLVGPRMTRDLSQNRIDLCDTLA